MSKAAFGQSKKVRRRCESCRERVARFRYRGVVKADRDHTLCFECFRAERDRRRARLLADVPSGSPLVSRTPAPHGLTPRAVVHRQQMLDHLIAVESRTPVGRSVSSGGSRRLR